MQYLKTAAQTAKKNVNTLYNGVKGKKGAIFDYSILNQTEATEELKNKIINFIAEARFFKDGDILTYFETFTTNADGERVYILLEFERTAIYNEHGERKYIAFTLSGIRASFYRLNYYGTVYADETPSHFIKAGKQYEGSTPIFDYTITEGAKADIIANIFTM